MRKQGSKIHIWMFIVICVMVTLMASNYCSAQTTAEIVKAITPEAGVLGSSWTGKPEKTILIFEENHISRVGQVELALMLTRLYNTHHIKAVAVEGAFVTEGFLDGKWFYSLSDKYAREETALQLLRRGEISAAEFVALAIPEVKVYGVEKVEEHAFGMLTSDEAAPTIYIYAIAEKLFPQDERKIIHANELAKKIETAPEEKKAELVKELMDYVIGANEWTKTRYERMQKESMIFSIEEILTLLEEIRAKAEEVHADVGEYKEAFGNLLEFYRRAAKRTETIVRNALKLCDSPDGIKLLPIIMGAAHTKGACAILQKNEVSYAVVSPLSLSITNDKSDLSLEALERKRNKQSVDEMSFLGARLDGRWKPSPTIGLTSIRNEHELYYLCNEVAWATAQGERPPFDSLRDEFTRFRYTRVDTSSFEIIGGEVIFKVTAETRDGPPITIWCRALMRQRAERTSLEDRLTRILRDMRERGIPVENRAGFLFTLGLEFQHDLDNTRIPTKELRTRFQKAGISLSPIAVVSIQEKDWLITDKHEIFSISRGENDLKVQAVLKLHNTSRDVIAVFSKEAPVIHAVSVAG